MKDNIAVQKLSTNNTSEKIDQLCINTIRTLAMDAMGQEPVFILLSMIAIAIVTALESLAVPKCFAVMLNG